jgi:hypothetical protein
MITSCTVRKYKLLPGDVYKVYVINVDDETASYSQEVGALGTKLISDHAFELSKLIGHQTLPVVDGHYIGVVSFGRNVNKLVLRDSQELSAF